MAGFMPKPKGNPSNKDEIPLLRTTQMVELLRMSPVHFGRLVHSGELPKPSPGGYCDLFATVHAHQDYLARQAEKAKAAGPEQQLVITRERKVAAELEALERKNALAAGEVAPIARLEEVMAEAVVIARTHLLSIPAAMAPRLAVISDPQQIENALEQEITDATEELAALGEGLVGEEPPDGGGEGGRAA
jgi:hypothetical protein